MLAWRLRTSALPELETSVKSGCDSPSEFFLFKTLPDHDCGWRIRGHAMVPPLHSYSSIDLNSAVICRLHRKGRCSSSANSRKTETSHGGSDVARQSPAEFLWQRADAKVFESDLEFHDRIFARPATS